MGLLNVSIRLMVGIDVVLSLFWFVQIDIKVIVINIVIIMIDRLFVIISTAQLLF